MSNQSSSVATVKKVSVTNVDKYCSFCNTVITTTKKKYCSRCKLTYYCNRDHQSKHWKMSHKKQCQKIQQNKTESKISSTGISKTFSSSSSNHSFPLSNKPKPSLLSQYTAAYSPEVCQQWIISQNIDLRRLSMQLCTSGCFKLKFSMDLYNIKSLQNVSQAADSNDLLNKGYATLHNIESMDASIQMLHGRITTMVIGLRRQHPMLQDAFGATNGLSALVLDVNVLKSKHQETKKIKEQEGSTDATFSLNSDATNLLSIGKPKGATGGAFVLFNAGNLTKGSVKHNQQRKYAETVVEHTAVFFNFDLGGRTHLTIDITSAVLSFEHKEKGFPSPSPPSPSSYWIGFFLYYFNTDTKNADMISSLNKWQPSYKLPRACRIDAAKQLIRQQEKEWDLKRRRRGSSGSNGTSNGSNGTGNGNGNGTGSVPYSGTGTGSVVGTGSGTCDDDTSGIGVVNGNENDISTSSVCETKNTTTTAPLSTPTLTTAEINAINDTFLIQQEEIYDALVFDADAKVGYRKSHDSREKLDKDEDSSSFYYGEIRFSIFAKAIHKIKTLYNGLNKDGGVFYDLGSGSGKMVLAAALLHPFSKSIGIEYLSDLHDLSQILVQRYYKSEKRNNTTSVLTKLGDICDETFPWFEDADVIYCNMLAFEEELLHKVRELLKRVRPGTFVLTTGKFIISVVCSL